MTLITLKVSKDFNVTLSQM